MDIIESIELNSKISPHWKPIIIDLVNDIEDSKRIKYLPKWLSKFVEDIINGDDEVTNGYITIVKNANMILLQDLMLVTRNARDKVQQVNIKLSQDGNTFYINRTTGQYKGKLTDQPLITINAGKARRTVLEQATLEFNSRLKKYKDRGYIDIKDLTGEPFWEITEMEMDQLVPSVKSDARGHDKKPL